MMLLVILLLLRANMAVENQTSDLRTRDISLNNTSHFDVSTELSTETSKLVTTIPIPETVIATKRINWKFSQFRETPFIAVLHGKNFLNYTMNNISGFHSGKACGGVLVTQNWILTLCACIRTFYMIYKLERLPDKNDVER